MVHSVAYESQASVSLAAPDLLNLLQRSRAKNAALGISGILLYRHGTFLQLLEGPRDQVEELYALIATDPRHDSVSTVLVEDRPERRFPDWTMGFGDVDGDFGHVDGYNDVLSSLRGPDGAESQQFLELLALFASDD